MKIAVVGSRDFKELNLVTKYVNAIRLEDGFEYFINWINKVYNNLKLGGTKFTIDYAKARGKDIEAVRQTL